MRTWQKAKDLTVIVYKLTDSFPKSEQFGLVSQIRRSSVSIGANIAEGFSRASQKDKGHFYTMALGSLTETLSHTYIAFELSFINQPQLVIIEEKVEVIHKMINGLIKAAPGKPA